jgi:hypothetical protein
MRLWQIIPIFELACLDQHSVLRRKLAALQHGQLHRNTSSSDHVEAGQIVIEAVCAEMLPRCVNTEAKY